MHTIPVVYGMTIGELAQMINGESWLSDGRSCNLTVIACTSYDHTMTYELPVPPSPNLPNLRSVLLYPSLCFFEGTEVSVGRGTTKQFQVIGHPAYSPEAFGFTPSPMPGAMHPPHAGVSVYGTDLSETPINEILTWKRLNLSWLLQYHKTLDPSDKFFLSSTAFFDKLAGTDQLRQQIEQGWTEAQIRASWAKDLDHFRKQRAAYLLYPDFPHE
jgi:uncharacterized protein YbbC (DUF1343 family)